MKIWIAFLLSAALLLSAAGCGGPAGQSPAADQPRAEDKAPSALNLENQSISPSEGESAPDAKGAVSSEPEAPRILIAYFTWADNTVVDPPPTR